MEEYKRYDEYKDSGVKWIGEIPKKWQVTKLKYYLVKNESGIWGNEPKEQEKSYKVLRSTEITKNGKWKIDNPAKRYIEKGNREKYMIDKNDLLVVKSSGSLDHLGKTVIANKSIKKEKYLFSNFLQRLKLSNYYPKYLYYMFNNNIIKTQFRYLSTTTTGLNNLSAKIFNNLIIPIPSIQEQKRIASFLDQKTNEIDKIINKKENIIEKLKEYKKSVITESVTKGKLGDKYINEDGELVDEIEMKDSGVEWLGEIPQYFQLTKIRRIATVNQGLQIAINQRFEKKVENSYKYITVKYINSEKEEDLYYIKNPSMEVLCNKEDILYARTGATGQVITNIRGVFHNNFFKVNYNKDKIQKDYLYRYLTLEKLKERVLLLAGTTTIPDLNHDDFLDLNILLPPIVIQSKITEFLTDKIAKINNLIEKINSSIDKYKSYKKSLIFEAVTGKIDLREYEVEEGEESVKHNNTRKAKRESLSRVN